MFVTRREGDWYFTASGGLTLVALALIAVIFGWWLILAGLVLVPIILYSFHLWRVLPERFWIGFGALVITLAIVALIWQ